MNLPCLLTLCIFTACVVHLAHAKLTQFQMKKKFAINQEENKSGRRNLIIGGDEARLGDYPYFVHYSQPGCGGSLIAPDIVLTAGHCQMSEPSDYGTVYVGRYAPGQDNAEGFSVVSQVIHPEFNGQVCCGKADGFWFYGVSNDFMLLKLSRESRTRPIQLNKSEFRPYSGEKLHVIGFGDIAPGTDFVRPDKLHQVSVNYMTNDECLSDSVYTPTLLTSMSMCASDRGEDACSGDSGGPLIARGITDADDVLMGIVSWGLDCAVHPGVYARISSGYTWIQDEVCRMSDNPPSSFRCPKPPTSRPTPAPTDVPSRKPQTVPPTRVPSPMATTKRPSTVPTTKRPSPLPSFLPTSHRPTRLPTLTDGPSTSPTEGGSSSQHTITHSPSPKPTVVNDNQTSFDDTTDSELSDANNQQQQQQQQAFLAIQRRALPTGKSCSSASRSSVVCCSSYSSGTDDDTFGEPCYPSSHGGAFQGGMPCEALSWIEKHDPMAYDPNVCKPMESSLLLASTTNPTISDNANSTDDDLNDELQHLISSPVSIFENRQFLPPGMSCGVVTDPTKCCESVDNRNQTPSATTTTIVTNSKSNGNGNSRSTIFDSIYHGQPCVVVDGPSGGGGGVTNEYGTTSGGGAVICQPANLMAELSPESVLDCMDVSNRRRRPRSSDEGSRIPSSSSFMMMMMMEEGEQQQSTRDLDQYLQYLQDEIESNRREQEESHLQWNRTLLTGNQTCKAITNPMICCGAREKESHCETIKVKNNNNDEESSTLSSSSWIVVVEHSGGMSNSYPISTSTSSSSPFECVAGVPKKKATSDRRVEETIILDYNDDDDDSNIVLKVDSDLDGSGGGKDDEEWRRRRDEEDAVEDDKDDDYCERLMEKEIRRRSPIMECSSLRRFDSCCSAMDSTTGQPCIFVSSHGCTTIDWVITHLDDDGNNSMDIVDCTSPPTTIFKPSN